MFAGELEQNLISAFLFVTFIWLLHSEILVLFNFHGVTCTSFPFMFPFPVFTSKKLDKHISSTCNLWKHTKHLQDIKEAEYEKEAHNVMAWIGAHVTYCEYVSWDVCVKILEMLHNCRSQPSSRWMHRGGWKHKLSLHTPVREHCRRFQYLQYTQLRGREAEKGVPMLNKSLALSNIWPKY